MEDDTHRDDRSLLVRSFSKYSGALARSEPPMKTEQHRQRLAVTRDLVVREGITGNVWLVHFFLIFSVYVFCQKIKLEDSCEDDALQCYFYFSCFNKSLSHH